VESAIGSPSSPELAAALHRLRSTLARLKAELELTQTDGTEPPVSRLLGDVEEALAMLREVERAALGLVTVLVVDDDARLGELTARGLRRSGYEAESTGSYREPRPGEVVVFDLGLYLGLDEAARSVLRSAAPIVVTGATDPGSRALAKSLNASDYLVKPVELEDLLAAIRRRAADGHGSAPG
jgi:CheY-like chemotaxis protein